MAGKHRGVAAIIQSTCPKAVYVHCVAHSLNLCVVTACSVQAVKTMMSTMVEVCRFFSNSPKRQLELECQLQSMVEATSAQKLVYINLCYKSECEPKKVWEQSMADVLACWHSFRIWT